MPNTVLAITVDPYGQSVAVNITQPSSLTFGAYTTRDGSTQVTFPKTITTRTVFYMDTAHRYNVSLVGSGGENGNGQGGVATLDLRGGNNASLGYVSPSGTSATGTLLASVVAPTATGTAATDTANLQAAINATPVGGLLYIPTGAYKINAALTIAAGITVLGAGVQPVMSNHTAGNGPYLPVSPYLAGTTIEQTTAATDGIVITGSGTSVNLRHLGIKFTSGLASTGHGVNATTTQTYGGALDLGPVDFLWENVQVYGHDGNHYGFVLTNPLNGTITHARSYGGGGFSVVSNSSSDDFGNIVFTHPYVLVFNTGSSAGYKFTGASGTGANLLNLMVFLRPQVNFYGAALAAATQASWDEYGGTGTPNNMTVVGADFECGSAPFHPGPKTAWIGNTFATGYNSNLVSLGLGALRQSTTQGLVGINAVAVGASALAANTTGVNNIAIGGSALTANTTGQDNTAIGDTALYANIGAGANTAIGSRALFTLNGAGGSNTAIGYNAGRTLSNASANTIIGASALMSGTTGGSNVAIGYSAGNVSGKETTTASTQTLVGFQAGQNSSTQNDGITAIGANAKAGGTGGGAATAVGATASATSAYAVALGYGTTASAIGSVAIGTDSGGTSASAGSANVIALGTANHQISIKNNSTGAGSAALGANCPATTATAPYTWFKMLSADGSSVYIPAWK